MLLAEQSKDVLDMCVLTTGISLNSQVHICSSQRGVRVVRSHDCCGVCDVEVELLLVLHWTLVHQRLPLHTTTAIY